MHLPLLIVFLILSIITGAQKTKFAYKAEPGVSEDLALYRKQVLSGIHYTLKLQIPETIQQAVVGDEEIIVFISDNTSPLQIDFKEQQDHLKSLHVNGVKIPIVLKNEHIIVAGKFLRKGKNTILISFAAGNLSLNRNEDFLYTLLVPDRSRTVFPCFDQPDLKATFTLTLTIPVAWLAVTNAPLLDSSRTVGNKTYHFAQSDTISTYLFSFVAGNFSRISKNIKGRVMNFFHRETDTSKIGFSTDSIFRIHGDALQYLQEYTQIPYPFKKFDFAAIPDFQYGGMEHVGAIDYKASSLFLDSGATKAEENSRANLIAHETAHMWFGDLVTMKWFNDVWMKEVFANFMADKVGQVSQANNNYDLKFLLDHFPAAYAVDRTSGANPIGQQLSNLQEAGSLYGNIIYHKAPVMMRQLERLMGKEAFRNGLRDYLDKYKFRNASWHDLISILDSYTSEGLEEWNKAWVNEPGRPVIQYGMEEKNGRIAKLTIKQEGERKSGYALPQFFEIALIYNDRVEEYRVHMKQRHLVLGILEGKQWPECILFNSSGQGYGLFPSDSNMLTYITSLKNPVMRAAAYINLYENMLNDKVVTPLQLLTYYQSILSKEPEELNLRLITNHISEIYWRFILPSSRAFIGSRLEKQLWQAMSIDTTPNKKKLLFKAFQSIALSGGAKDTLYGVWKNQMPPPGVKLTEEDYSALAMSLTVKDYPSAGILQQQLQRIKNVDRRNRLQFLMPALSAKVQDRDAFFHSLIYEKNREKESWVVTALEYLHHPLRATSSGKYLKQSLDLLQEIQLTGDIFFPAAWLESTFGYYQTPQAAAVVRNFLKSHPRYNKKLKAKILQATDLLFRAERLVGKYN